MKVECTGIYFAHSTEEVGSYSLLEGSDGVVTVRLQAGDPHENDSFNTDLC